MGDAKRHLRKDQSYLLLLFKYACASVPEKLLKNFEGREYINLLFKLEKRLSNEERKEKRQEATLEAFWLWVEKTDQIPTSNENLTQGLGYVQNQRKYLETFLEDRRIEISNNLCESHIRLFATSRPALLFADTPKGATANAVLYTVVETAKANNLNVYEHLKYLLSEMPNIDFHNKPGLLESYLPWSDKLPKECMMTIKNKKCLK